MRVPRNWRELREWSRSAQGRKLIRFTLTSVIATVVSETVIIVAYGLRLIPGEVQATVFGNIVGMVPAYNLNRRWAWGKRGRSRLGGEIAPFLAMSLTGGMVALLGATYARHLVHAHHWSHLVNTAIVGGTNIASFAMFWFLKMLLFNRIFHHAEAPTKEFSRGSS